MNKLILLGIVFLILSSCSYAFNASNENYRTEFKIDLIETYASDENYQTRTSGGKHPVGTYLDSSYSGWFGFSELFKLPGNPILDGRLGGGTVGIGPEKTLPMFIKDIVVEKVPYTLSLILILGLIFMLSRKKKDDDSLIEKKPKEVEK